MTAVWRCWLRAESEFSMLIGTTISSPETVSSRRETAMFENLGGWLINVATLWGVATSPIFGLIAIFMGWKAFFRSGKRMLGSIMFATGVVVTIAGVTSLASPGKLTWLYATFRDVNPFS